MPGSNLNTPHGGKALQQEAKKMANRSTGADNGAIDHVEATLKSGAHRFLLIFGVSSQIY